MSEATFPPEALTEYSDVDFAHEVRFERLSLLWRFTFLGAFMVFWGLLIMATLTRVVPVVWLGASALIALGCGLTAFFVKRRSYALAVWFYTGGVVAAIGLLLYRLPGVVQDGVPYAFVLLIFVVGLLLSPRAMILLMALAVAVTLGVPYLREGAFVITEHQILALVLTGLGALMAAEITGELYGIAEWALSSYRRERERKLELHESQTNLRRALARAHYLAESLEAANVELEAARQAAEEAKNFRGQFLANMSHELRTPLNAVIGFSETMLKFPEMYDGVALPGEYERDLQQIYTSGAQLLHVINDILDLSRVDAGKLDVQHSLVDLEPIIKASLTTAVGLVGDKPIKLVRDLPAELPEVWADSNRVRQVLLNLYSNAVKFTEEGAITLRLQVVDDFAVISLSDTGCGIEPDEIEAIFEEFRQGRAGKNKQHTGSGLGLSISRHLVRLMNGRIWAESQVGSGSTFFFTLPLVKDDDTLSTRKAAPVLQAVTSR